MSQKVASQASSRRAPFHGPIKMPRDGWGVLLFNIVLFLCCLYFVIHQVNLVLPENHPTGGTIKEKSEAEEAQEAQEQEMVVDDDEDDEEDAHARQNPLEKRVGIELPPQVEDEAWVKEEVVKDEL